MGAVMAALAIRPDYEPADLRRRAARDGDRRAALRLLAIANALEGMPRAEAARLAGMERQALRCCASMPRDLRASTTTLAGVAPSG